MIPKRANFVLLLHIWITYYHLTELCHLFYRINNQPSYCYQSHLSSCTMVFIKMLAVFENNKSMLEQDLLVTVFHVLRFSVQSFSEGVMLTIDIALIESF